MKPAVQEFSFTTAQVASAFINYLREKKMLPADTIYEAEISFWVDTGAAAIRLTPFAETE